jgi:hypothetical protein
MPGSGLLSMGLCSVPSAMSVTLLVRLVSRSSTTIREGIIVMACAAECSPSQASLWWERAKPLCCAFCEQGAEASFPS